MPRMHVKMIAAIAFIFVAIAGNLNAKENAMTSDEDALVKLEHDWMDAENRRDERALSALLDDRFIATFGTEKAIGKPQYVKNLTHGTADPTARQDMVNENLIVDGNTAVAVAFNTISGTRDGKPFDVAIRITLTFIKRDDQWRALALHGILVKKT